ncbi:(Fe-S)-binding protein [Conexibacter sp. DBS9H8]|uniref:(Fe-S)-binding protein n=1 Tax=Conexibacter sp. DBS9H8 TaxID=2937801 RepID=UPI00200D8AD1|nr:(Fe-S)-binding protein [Conexibacter sp. DBS9H8]
MAEPIFPIVFGIAMLTFAVTLFRRARLLLAAAPAARFDHIPQRLRRMTIDALAQRKFLRGEQPAGIMHAIIFWAFMVLLLQVITLFGGAFNYNFHIPGFGANQILGPPFFLARDILEFGVIVAVSYMLYRRLIAHTPRLFGLGRAEDRYRQAPHWEGILILLFILMIMVGGLLHDAGLLVANHTHGNARTFAPLTALVADLLSGLSAHSALIVSKVGWWMHNVTVVTFLNLLPLSKHFHIITAVPNVFFSKLTPETAPRTFAVTHVPASVARLDPPPKERPGVATLADVTWKQVLDSFSCTECGRCSSVCPATASGAPLAPRQVILDIRDRLYRHPDEQHGAVAGAEPLIGADVLWSCTTCMACVEACPVGIEHVPTIVDMRRTLVDRGEMEPLLQKTLENFSKQGNSYGKSAKMRARWTKELDFSIPDARKEPVQYLWFVGDFASFDERVQAASRRVARILHGAGVSFGMLYDGERNAGNDVRRVGEEGLFELLVEHNLGALADAEYEAIFTTDPHSLNTLRNEYPAYGLDKPVYHYTELLAELVQAGQIRLTTPLTGTRVTYHDPCYLARYNRITDAPRALIAASGAQLIEMPRHGTNTFCCGAGGGRVWMDDSGLTERPSEQRIREAQALGELDYFIVSCPKDLAMYSDAAKTVGASFAVAELTALIEPALAAAEPLLAGVGAGASAMADGAEPAGAGSPAGEDGE